MITTIDKLFEVSYGQIEYENKTPLEGLEGNNLLISSKGDDNGVYGFYDIENYYSAPIISIPRTGTIGHAFVQLKDCSIDNNCLLLKPKKNLSVEELFQIAFQLRLNKWKYKYGRQITPERIKKQEIILIQPKIKYNELVENQLPKAINKKTIEPFKEIRLVPVTDLCVISKKTALPQNAMSDGNTPYVTTTFKNNGISNWVSDEPNNKAKCLTVALNGSCGETFFQFDDFITSGDNAVLNLKKEYNPYLLLYIGKMIEREQWRYNYYRKLNMTKLKKMKIPVPYTNNKIDIKYIQKVIENCYGFNELKKFL